MRRPLLALLVVAWVFVGCDRRPGGSATDVAARPPSSAPSPAILTVPGGPKPEAPKLDPPFAPAMPPKPHVIKRPGRRIGGYGGELRLAAPSAPKTFNPLRIDDVHTAAMLRHTVYSSLLEYDRESYKVEPQIAQDWSRSEDGRTWTFGLRSGVQWSDGTPLTAADVVFTFEAAMDAQVSTSARDVLRDSTGALPRVEAKGEREVVFRLRGIHVLFLQAVASVFILPRHKWETVWRKGGLAQALGTEVPVDQIVSSGPFRVRAFTPGTSLVLERNPYSFHTDARGNRLPYLDRLTWQFVEDYDDALRRFVAGEIDVYDQVRPTDFDLLKSGEAEGGYTVWDLGPSMRTNFLAFNLKPARAPWWLRDRRFRVALAHAIDRDALVREVLLGRGRPLYTIVTDADRVWGHEVASPEPSPRKALGLLKEMGLVDRDGDGLLEDKESKHVTLELATNAEDSLRVRAAALVATQLRRIGVGIDVKPVPFASLVTQLTDTGDWQAVLLGFGGNIPPDPVMWKGVYLSSGHLHVWNPGQPKPGTAWETKIDGLVGQLTATNDFLARKAAHDEILDILNAEQPLVFLYSPDLYVAARGTVGNFRPSLLRPHGTWNSSELYLATAGVPSAP